MRYFVTGGTGLIGRHLVELLLQRDEEVAVLVREGSRDKLDALVERWGAGERVVPVLGDVAEPRLGLSDDDVERLRGVEHVFHLAALYDMTADDESNERLNVAGTRHAVELANELGAGRLHHVSSVAVAGTYDGYFREDMFDEGQELPSSYHRTKFEAEAAVRAESRVPWRVYRPAVVVGHSVTGEMDKIDGPYYFFPLLKRLRGLLPPWVPLAGPELGSTNVVPVDFVAAAIDHISHLPDLDGQAFHLCDRHDRKAGDILNVFAEAGHAPRMAVRIDKKLLDLLPKGALSMALQLPALKEIRKTVLADLGIPEEVLGHVALVPTFDTRDTERALAGTDIAVPPLEAYAPALWDFWERHLDPELHKDRSLGAAVAGRTVLITGASSGIGAATARAAAAAGATVLLVSRGRDKLEELAEEIRAEGGTAHVHPADLTDLDDIARLAEEVLGQHEGVDFLINNAGRSIRRSVQLSLDRFHDFERTMQLNYFGAIKLVMALLPSMIERGRGHVVNVSSIGVQTSPPRFSAYVASKAALDAWTRTVASEVVGSNVTFTTVHMPLVKTPMIAPTKIYDSFPTITPEEAAEMICEGMRTRPKHIGTRLGTAGEVGHAVAPKIMDQVLHLAYQVFPDSTAAKGEKKEGKDSGDGGDGSAEKQGSDGRLSGEARALAQLMKGVHW